MTDPQPAPVPQPAAKAPNIAGIIALVSGLLALVVLPIVLGPVALISGVVGHQVARHRGTSDKLPLAGILLGVIAILVVLYRLGYV